MLQIWCFSKAKNAENEKKQYKIFFMIKNVTVVLRGNNPLCINWVRSTTVLIPNSYNFLRQVNTYTKLLKNFYSDSFVSYYLKLTWRGKAYRVRLFKKSSKFTFSFNHSHWCKLTYSKSTVTFSRLRRQSYIVLFAKRSLNPKIQKIFNEIRPYNKYTRRGLRLKKSFYMQRFGKISQVNSILHSF